MPFLSVTLIVDARCVEALSDALLERGALAVDVTDADAGTPSERPLFAEPGSAPALNWQANRDAWLEAHSKSFPNDEFCWLAIKQCPWLLQSHVEKFHFHTG